MSDECSQSGASVNTTSDSRYTEDTMSVELSQSVASVNIKSLPGVTLETLSTVLSHPFCHLGKLVFPTSSSSQRYNVAISLWDESVWIIYDAWNRCCYPDDISAESDYGPDGEEAPQSPFLPDNQPDWAELPGRKGKVLMAKVTTGVKEWQFNEGKRVNMNLSEAWKAADVVPVFVRVRRMDIVVK